MTEKQKTTTDAPASVTYTIQRNGFQILFTVRGEAGAELLEAMDTIEKKLTDKGYTPQEKKSFGFPKKEVQTVPNRKCPMCNQDLVFGTTKDGKKFIKCSTQKYDFQTKQTLGCKFFEWDNLSSNKEQF
jgi:transcription initiation factor IIE alpha subunit